MKIKSVCLMALLLSGVAVVAACNKQPIDERYYRNTQGVEYSGGWNDQQGYKNQKTVQSTTTKATTKPKKSEGDYNKSPIVGAPEIDQDVCPYGAIPGTCDCPAGLVAVDGVCTGVQCREGKYSSKNHPVYDCYYGENMCGQSCNAEGRKCNEGACFADEAACKKITVGKWVFNPKVSSNRGGCEQKAEKLGCFKNSKGLYTCYRDGQYCGTECNADGTACQYGMCIPQTCNNIDGKRWTFTHIGFGDYGYGCMNPEGTLKCTKDKSTYRCFWPRKGDNWHDVLYTYPCSKDGKCKNR